MRAGAKTCLMGFLDCAKKNAILYLNASCGPADRVAIAIRAFASDKANSRAGPLVEFVNRDPFLYKERTFKGAAEAIIADASTCRRYAMTWKEKRYRIARHYCANRASGFRPAALLCQPVIGTNLPQWNLFQALEDCALE
jgi:hypothetical protein